MDRKTSVALELRDGQFRAGAVTDAKLIGNLDDKVEKLDRSITKIPPDAAKAAAAMKLLGDETGKARVKLDDFGRGSTGLGQIDQRLAAARIEAKRFLDEFNRTGGGLQGFFRADREVKELERLQKSFARHLEQGARDAAPAVSRSITSSFEGVSRSGVIGGLIAGGIAASPLIGAALNGVLLAGVGLGGVALGIAGQIHDPEVHAALAALGNDLLTTLRTATVPFQGPLIEAIVAIRQVLHGALTSTNFAGLAETLGPLARGLAGLIREAGPGVREALAAAIPMLLELARLLPQIGHGLSTMFHLMSQGSTGAMEGLRALVAFIVGALVTIGWLVMALSNLFAAFVKLGDIATRVSTELIGWVPLLGDMAKAAHHIFEVIRFGTGGVEQLGRNLKETGDAALHASVTFAELSSRIGETNTGVNGLAAAMSQKMFNAFMSVDQATLSWHQSLLQVHDALAQNGKTLDINTEKGQANRQAILGAVQANMAQYQAFIAAGGSARDAAADYDTNTRALEGQLRKAGLTQQAIDGLIGKYRDIPNQVNTSIALYGIEDAIQRLIDLQRKLAGLPYSREINVRVNTITTSSSSPTTLPHAGPQNRASGGPVFAGQSYIVGEHRPEWFVPDVNGRIVPDLGGLRAASVASGAKASINLNVTVTDDTGRMLRVIRKEVLAVGAQAALAVVAETAR